MVPRLRNGIEGTATARLQAIRGMFLQRILTSRRDVTTQSYVSERRNYLVLRLGET